MPEKLKVLILTERFYPEEFVVNDLAAEWATRNMRVDVLTQAPSYPAGKMFPAYFNYPLSRETWKNIQIIRFFTITGYRDSLFLKLLNYFSFAFVGTLVAFFTSYKYDKVFVYQTGPLTLALPAVLAKRLYKKDVTIWTQDVWPDTVYAYGFRKTRILSYVLDKFVSFVYNSCDRIFISCEGFREKLAPYAFGKPIYHFPNWPAINPETEGESKEVKLSNKFNYTFAGNIGKVQNLENVVRGFGLAAAENNDIQLNIVGDGSQVEQLKKITTDEGIHNVVFWGRKQQAEMPAYFSASDVMVISLSDKPIFSITVPAKFQAYLAFSKPIYCVMNGEVRRLVEENKIGLCAKPDDLGEIKDGFLRFYELRGGGLKSLEDKAQSLLESKYNKLHIINSMAELLKNGTAT